MMQASATPWPPHTTATSGGSFVHVPLRPEFQRTPRNDVLSVGFNQNCSLLLIGTEAGFRVYQSDSLQEYMKREAAGRGLAMVEILHRSNVLALVGGGLNPLHPINKVMLYSNAEDRCFGELAFRSVIRAVRLLPNYVVVVSEFKVYVYDFELKLAYEFETLSNIPGVVAATSPTSADPSASVLACPSQRTGEVRMKRFNKRGSYLIQAHDETVSCLALNPSGSLLATASTRGTLINIFRTSDGAKLQELRRGGDPATIYSMAFSANSRWLAISSSKETVHVFTIKAEETPAVQKFLFAPESGSRRFLKAGSMLLSSAAATAGSSLSFVKGMMPKLFISERSLCQFRLPKKSRAKVGFGLEKNTILVACTDGSLYKCSFDPVKGGPCRLQQDFYFR